MDLTEIEMGINSDASLKKNENKGIVNRCPLRSISMDGSTGDYLYKKPYSYARQNSINDSREYNDLKDKKDKDDVNSISYIGIHNQTWNKSRKDVDNSQDNRSKETCFVRQVSAVSASQELLEKDIPVTSDKKMTEHVLIESKSEYSDVPTLNEKRNRRNGACLYSMSWCSCALSIVTFALMLLAYLKVSNFSDEQRQEIATSVGFSHHGQATSEVNTAGSFKIDQTYLHEHKRIVWLRDENSEIIPSNVDDCLTVPYGGKYLVISRFTFNILPGDDVTTITHFFKLKTSSGAAKDGGYKRKYVSVLEGKLRTSNELDTNLELRKPSVFIEFFDLDAYDQICPNVSSPALLYESRMDNDVNIIKV